MTRLPTKNKYCAIHQPMMLLSTSKDLEGSNSETSSGVQTLQRPILSSSKKPKMFQSGYALHRKRLQPSPNGRSLTPAHDFNETDAHACFSPRRRTSSL